LLRIPYSKQQQHQHHPTYLTNIMVRTRGGADTSSPEETTTATANTTTSTTTNTTTTDATTTTTGSSKVSWSDVRRTLFPIYDSEEVKKFLLIGSIKFFVILALTLTRDTKDTLVVTQCGAEAIAFLKVRI
jgi:hypothetical protein